MGSIIKRGWGICNLCFGAGNWGLAARFFMASFRAEVPNMPVKYGVIGCGAIGQRRHIPECIANPDSKLVALADPVAERVAELGKKFGARHYTDYKEMLKDRDVKAGGN